MPACCAATGASTLATFAVITVLMAGAWYGLVMLQDTWYTLLIAAALGILFTQYAFITHEISHRQVFESGKVSEFSGRFMADLVVGISYSWWMSKHSRHHANPNTVGKDPDIEPDYIVFLEEDAKGHPASSAGSSSARAGCSSRSCWPRASTSTSTRSSRCSPRVARSTSARSRSCC